MKTISSEETKQKIINSFVSQLGFNSIEELDEYCKKNMEKVAEQQRLKKEAESNE